MNRSQFILSLTLLCVAGTLAFMVSFRLRETTNSRESLTPVVHSPAPAPRLSNRQSEPVSLPLSPRRQEQVDPTHYEVTVADITLQDVGAKIEREARQRLKSMTDQYQLTANQRRQIFPILVSHHADFTEGLVVNGSPATPPGRGESFSEQVYPLLDLTQQANFQDDILADGDWWRDILGQLRDDLDRAFENGEVDLVTDSILSRPARGTGSTLPE